MKVALKNDSLSHKLSANVKKISRKQEWQTSRARRTRHAELRIQVSFVTFKNKESTMSTKTAILSIAELKKENLPVLRAAFEALPGVKKIDFSLERSVAVLDFDPSQSHIDDFLRAALKAGFQVL
jgi:hypothetical protein